MTVINPIINDPGLPQLSIVYKFTSSHPEGDTI